MLHVICKKRANWIGSQKNFLLRQVFDSKIKGRVEVTGRRRRRRKQLLDDLKEEMIL